MFDVKTKQFRNSLMWNNEINCKYCKHSLNPIVYQEKYQKKNSLWLDGGSANIKPHLLRSFSHLSGNPRQKEIYILSDIFSMA